VDSHLQALFQDTDDKQIQRGVEMAKVRILPVNEQICLKCGDALDIEPSMIFSWYNLADVDLLFDIGCKNEECDFEVKVYKQVSFTKQDMIDAEV